MSAPLWIVVPAAGQGRRMGADVAKQYLKIGGKSILQYTLYKLLSLPAQQLVLVLDEDDKHFDTLTIEHPHKQKVKRVKGGVERCHSVFNALEFLSDQAQPQDWVLVHDVARPCVELKDIENLLKFVEHDNNKDLAGAILASPVHDTLKQVAEQKIIKSVDRSLLWRAQTPQVFRFEILFKALKDVLEKQRLVTDEAMAVELLNHQVGICLGSDSNIKITTPSDLKLAEFLLLQL